VHGQFRGDGANGPAHERTRIMRARSESGLRGGGRSHKRSRADYGADAGERQELAASCSRIKRSCLELAVDRVSPVTRCPLLSRSRHFGLHSRGVVAVCAENRANSGQISTWRDGRVIDGGGLENLSFARTRTGGGIPWNDAATCGKIPSADGVCRLRPTTALLRSGHHAVALEKVTLRQQLAALTCSVKRPPRRMRDRACSPAPAVPRTFCTLTRELSSRPCMHPALRLEWRRRVGQGSSTYRQLSYVAATRAPLTPRSRSTHRRRDHRGRNPVCPAPRRVGGLLWPDQRDRCGPRTPD
jgi:hypothetical protein